jgi:hypothetical protein
MASSDEHGSYKKTEHLKPNESADSSSARVAQLHFKYGWYSLLLFLTLGLILETLHGFKLDFYLSGKNETRRLMWRLAHAHGAFLALIHIAFAATLVCLKTTTLKPTRRASRLLTFGGVLIPLGFFAGGIIVKGGDPMLAVILVPIGAVLLGFSVFLTARQISKLS